MDSRRREVVERIIAVFHELVVSFRDGPDECSFECSSIQLGALMKEMRAKRFDPKPETPLLGISIVLAMESARGIRVPVWDCREANGYLNYHRQGAELCDLRSLIQSKMDGLEKGIGGLTLSDFDDGRRSLQNLRS